jgi:hypothetical protein
MTHHQRPARPGSGINRTGLLIIRAWIEEGSSEPLRVEMRIAHDVSAGFERRVTLARTNEVCETVKEWLDDVAGHESSGEPPGVGPDDANDPVTTSPAAGRTA